MQAQFEHRPSVIRHTAQHVLVALSPVGQRGGDLISDHRVSGTDARLENPVFARYCTLYIAKRTWPPLPAQVALALRGPAAALQRPNQRSSLASNPCWASGSSARILRHSTGGVGTAASIVGNKGTNLTTCCCSATIR